MNDLEPVLNQSDLPSSSELGACSSYDEYVQTLMSGKSNQIGVQPNYFNHIFSLKFLNSKDVVETVDNFEELNYKDPDFVSVPDTSFMVDGQNVVTFNCDELTKENQELKQENNKLKQELENANKRNLLLQNYLVAADERLGQTLFIEKVHKIRKK